MAVATLDRNLPLRILALAVMAAIIGLAQWLGTPDDAGIDVLRRADQALYQAKRTGRNRLEVAPPLAMV